MDLKELYQEVIIDHNKNPRNYHDMQNATSKADGFNPLCGDKLTLYIKVDNDVIVDVSFVGCGCAISTASASLMTEALIGKSVSEAHDIFKRFHAMVIGADESSTLSLNKLTVLAGVKQYPSRVKCATLAWHTLEAALSSEKQTVTTE